MVILTTQRGYIAVESHFIFLIKPSLNLWPNHNTNNNNKHNNNYIYIQNRSTFISKSSRIRYYHCSYIFLCSVFKEFTNIVSKSIPTHYTCIYQLLILIFIYFNIKNIILTIVIILSTTKFFTILLMCIHLKRKSKYRSIYFNSLIYFLSDLRCSLIRLIHYFIIWLSSHLNIKKIISHIIQLLNNLLSILLLKHIFRTHKHLRISSSNCWLATIQLPTLQCLRTLFLGIQHRFSTWYICLFKQH